VSCINALMWISYLFEEVDFPRILGIAMTGTKLSILEIQMDEVKHITVKRRFTMENLCLNLKAFAQSLQAVKWCMDYQETFFCSFLKETI